MDQQRTLSEKVSCRGVGLHSGVPLQLTIHPARAHTGLVFVRGDCDPPVEIVARPSSVCSTSHATSLASAHDDSARVMTVEHLLSALYALGVDNAVLEVDGPEVPAMDGSAAPFADLVRTAGVFAQKEPRPEIQIQRPIEVVDGNRRIRIEPASELSVSYTVDFEHPAIRRQELHLRRINSRVFQNELARARTFGFLHEVSALLRAGLAQGGSLENTVVLDEERVLNTGGLRWPDEFVRHKIVDLLGDLSLIGIPLRGHLIVERGGHALHQMAVQALLAEPDSWEIIGDGRAVARGFA